MRYVWMGVAVVAVFAAVFLVTGYLFLPGPLVLVILLALWMNQRDKKAGRRKYGGAS